MRGKHLNSGIRGGLWEEQHFQGMGPAVWLFGWLIHRQTRERDGVGLVLAGSPLTYRIISQDTGIAERTLKRWMARLARAGYVQVTHAAHKRMIIRIAKAKKFGPQQFGFPQAPLFSPKSKGPLSALDTPSKGPSVAQKNAEDVARSGLATEACAILSAGHREIKPERKETARQPIANSGSPIDSVTSPKSTQQIRASSKISQIDSPPPNSPIRRPYPDRYGPDRKALREMEVRAELRVGAGPVIRKSDIPSSSS